MDEYAARLVSDLHVEMARMITDMRASLLANNIDNAREAAIRSSELEIVANLAHTLLKKMREE